MHVNLAVRPLHRHGHVLAEGRLQVEPEVEVVVHKTNLPRAPGRTRNRHIRKSVNIRQGNRHVNGLDQRTDVRLLRQALDLAVHFLTVYVNVAEAVECRPHVAIRPLQDDMRRLNATLPHVKIEVKSPRANAKDVRIRHLDLEMSEIWEFNLHWLILVMRPIPIIVLGKPHIAKPRNPNLAHERIPVNVVSANDRRQRGLAGPVVKTDVTNMNAMHKAEGQRPSMQHERRRQKPAGHPLHKSTRYALLAKKQRHQINEKNDEDPLHRFPNYL